MIAALAIIGLYVNSSTEPIRVACVGASIFAGVGTQEPATQSFPAQLQKVLGPGYDVRAFARSGAAVTKGSDNPYWKAPEFKPSQAFSPQIVVLGLGGNDARPENWTHVKDAFVPDLKELVGIYRALPSHPKVFVCLPLPRFDSARTNLDLAVLPLVKQAAREAQASVIDLYSLFDLRPELLPDKVHPTESGAGMIAVAVAEVIEDPGEKKKEWKLVSADSEETGEGPAKMAIDGDPYTYWHTNYSENETKPPHEIVVDLGRTESITAFRHLPRQDGGVNGRVRGFELYLSADGKNWGQPVIKGELKNISGWTTFPLSTTLTARFFRFRALSEWHNGPWTSVGELDIRRAIGSR